MSIKKKTVSQKPRGRCMVFTEEQVLAVRYMVAADPSSNKQLAEKYGCSITTINNICRHFTYPQHGGPMVLRKKSAKGESGITVTYPDGERPLPVVPHADSGALSPDVMRRNCDCCGIRIFDTFEEAQKAIPHATEVNVAAKGAAFIKQGEEDICLPCKLRPQKKKKEIVLLW